MPDALRLYHRASYDEDGAYVVDDRVAVAGYQLRPDTWDALTAWCDGVRILDADGNQAVAVNGSLAEQNVARLGDFVMHLAPTVWEVSRADGHYHRWAAAEPDAA